MRKHTYSVLWVITNGKGRKPSETGEARRKTGKINRPHSDYFLWNTNGNQLYAHDDANSLNVINYLHGVSTKTCLC